MPHTKHLTNKILEIMTKQILSIVALSMLFFLTSCDDKEETTSLNLNLSGLQDLGEGFAYEGWIMVDGTPQSAGIFTVDANGTPSQSSFELDEEALESATAYILTIEPSPDNDPAPSAVHILAGAFDGNSASVTVDHPAAIGTNFETAGGTFILATPTDDDMDNEASGVWFLDPMAGPAASLDLPTLPEGWAYEGWAVIEGQPVSTGTFTSANGNDSAAIYSGDKPGPPFPGEDFLNNAPSGLTFPTDLTSSTIVISVEPVPDNSPMPFTLKPLVRGLDAGAEVHSSITLNNNATATNPTGTVSR